MENRIFFKHLEVVRHDLLSQETGGWMLEVQSDELVEDGRTYSLANIGKSNWSSSIANFASGVSKKV
jgi:hypothetical protein